MGGPALSPFSDSFRAYHIPRVAGRRGRARGRPVLVRDIPGAALRLRRRSDTISVPESLDASLGARPDRARAGSGPLLGTPPQEVVRISPRNALRRIALTTLLAAAIGVCSPGAALADVWVDITDATWQNTYGVSALDAAVVAQGRSDGTFSPGETVNRGQFAKMTTSGLDISSMAPEVPTFRDVSPELRLLQPRGGVHGRGRDLGLLRRQLPPQRDGDPPADLLDPGPLAGRTGDRRERAASSASRAPTPP